MATEKRKSVCILGTASTMKQAPFEDETFDMWGVSSLTENPECKRLDRTFELHPRRYFGQLPVMVRLSKYKGPIYMQEHFEDIPNSVAYPREEVKAMFYLDAMGENLFVTNTITWMILLALYEGYQDIALFGVHMAHDTEYRYQAPSCSWALGIIQGYILSGKPYTLHIPDESELLKARYEYGFDEPSELMLEMDTRRKRLLAGVEEADKKLKALELSKARTEGAAQEAGWWHTYVSGYR
jgi:hypothetical protein